MLFRSGTNIFLNIVLVYFWGAQGAAIATAISAFIIYYVRRRAIGGGLKIQDPLVLWIMWSLVCLQAFLEIYTSLRFLEIIIVIVFILMSYRSARHTLKKMFANGKEKMND